MKIILPGGSGQIGRFLAQHFHSNGHEVIVLSRNSADAKWRTVVWDGQTLGDWVTEIDGADVVINLAGRSVNCRYNAQNRREIINSRVESTRILGQAIAQAKKPPAVWLQSSTATIYAHRFDAPNDEHTGILGGGERNVPETWRFSIDVAKQWEAAFEAAKTPQTRKVLLRSAMVMDTAADGVFQTLLRLVRFGLGGKTGSGGQFVSWIHHQDFIRVLEWLITHDDQRGIFNVAAPNPLPNADFMRVLRHAWGVPLGLAATTWMVEVGAFFLRTESELILKSRRVNSSRLCEAGFTFRYPQWETAAVDLCKRVAQVNEQRSRRQQHHHQRQQATR